MESDFRTYIFEIIQRLRSYLPEYLQKHDYVPNNKGWFRCPNPDHNDENPSAHLNSGTNNETFKCFSCQCGGSIIDAANMIESYPTHGKEFVGETLPALCAQFGIEYSAPTLTAYDMLQLNLYQLFKDVNQLLIQTGARTHAKSRGWDDDTIETFGLGTIGDVADLRSELKSKYGYTDENLNSGEINDGLFGSEKLTFTLKDHWGRPVGFSARDMSWTKGDKTKYKNTSGAVPIYNKSELLYGIDIARRQSGPLYMWEGYADVLSAYQAGITKSVAVCGTSITDGQVDILRRCGVTDLVLGFDYDVKSNGGRDAMLKALSPGGVLSGLDWLRVSILDIRQIALDERAKPIDDSLDADTILQSDGGVALITDGTYLQDAFRWRLEQFPETTPPDAICDTVIPLILNEQSNPRRELMVRHLADVTGFQFRTLYRELQSLLDKQSAETKEQIESIRYNTVKKLRAARSANVRDIIVASAEELQSIMKSTESPESLSQDETIRALDTLQEELNNLTDGLRGLDTGFERLNKALSGIPTSEAMILLAAPPNAGKSSFIDNLLWNILRFNYNDDVGVVMFTTDDSRNTFFKRLISIDSGLPTALVSQPVKIRSEDARAKLNKAWSYLRWFTENGYLHVKDNSHGSDLAFFKRWYDEIKEIYPDRKFIVFIDNLHKLSGPGGDERTKFTIISDTIHGWTTSLATSFICTAELRKTNGQRPDLYDLKETNKLYYDASLGLMLQNAMNDKFGGDCSESCWLDNGVPKPVIELEFQKNKLSDYKGWIEFEFDPSAGKYYEVDARQQNDAHA